MRRTGFSLIDMLTVVSVVFLLITLLVPALHSAREAGRRTHCIGNLHRLGLAFALYRTDYDNRFPGSGTFSWVLPDGSASSDPYELIHEYLGHWCPYWVPCEGGIGPVYYPRQGALYPYVRDERVYVCPSDHSPRCSKPRLSYSMNSELSFWPESYILQPSQLILLVEEGRGGVPDGTFATFHVRGMTELGEPQEWVARGTAVPCERMDARIYFNLDGYEFPLPELRCNHSQGSNVLYVDLSCRWMPRGRVVVEDTYVF